MVACGTNNLKYKLRKKTFKLLTLSAAVFCAACASAETVNISLPQIVNSSTLTAAEEKFSTSDEFFFTELGAIWIDGVDLDLSSAQITGDHVRFQVGGPDYPYQNATSHSNGGGSLKVGSISASGNNMLHVRGSSDRDALLEVSGDVQVSNLDIWVNGVKTTKTKSKLEVKGNLSASDKTLVNVQADGILDVAGNLTLNLAKNGSFYIATGKNVASLNVGKNFTFSNQKAPNFKLNPNDYYTDATIGDTSATIGGDFILQGVENASDTYFQFANSKGTGIKAANFRVNGAEGNTTSLLFSHGSAINAGEGLIELTPDGNNSKVQLFIGDSVSSPTTILASELKLNQTEDSDQVFVFLNNSAQNLRKAFTLAPRITGHGQIENLGGYNVLRNADSTFTGKTVVTDGTLVLYKPTAAGESSIEVNTEAGNTEKGLYLQFQPGDEPIKNRISGSGVIRVAGEVSVKSASINGYDGVWDVLGKLKTVDGTFNSSSSQWGKGTVNIEKQGSVIISDSSAIPLFTFDNLLTGSGTVIVNFSGSKNGDSLYIPTFKIEQGNASGFTGIVNLEGQSNKQVVYVLENNELSRAGIRVGSNSMLSLGKDDASKETFTLSGLEIDSGVLNIGDIQTGHKASNKIIQVTSRLKADGEGTVRIDTSTGFINTPPSSESELEKLQLTQQDDGLQSTSMQLINAAGAEVLGSGGGLSLVDQNGKVLSNGLKSQIMQDGTHVANANYDWKLTTNGPTGHADGLYLNYGLTEVELLGTGTTTLVLYGVAGKEENSPANDLSAKIIGSGDLAISAANGTVSLSNPENSYTGVTSVTSNSTLKLGADSALGKTSSVKLADGAVLNLNNHSQEIGTLLSSAGSVVDFAQSSKLVIANSENAESLSAGRLKGSGQLVVEKGILKVEGANGDFHAATSIDAGAKVQINSASGLGNEDIQNNGKLILTNIAKPEDLGNPNNPNTYLGFDKFANQLAGSGDLKIENSTVSLAGDNSAFNGCIAIDQNSDVAAFKNANLGTGAIANNGKLEFLFDEENSLINNALSGNGKNVVHGYVTVSKDAIQNNSYTGDWLVLGKLTADKGADTSQELWGSGKTELFDIFSRIEVFVSDKGFTYNNRLSGDGTLLVSSDPDAAGKVQEFRFADGLNNSTIDISDTDKFEGLIVLQGNDKGNLLYVLKREDNLEDVAVDLRKGAELKTDEKEVSKTVHDLFISGGTISFDKELQIGENQNAQIKVRQHLDLSSTGTVKTKLESTVLNKSKPDVGDAETSSSILTHDDYLEKAPRISLIEVEDSNWVNGYAGGIELFVNGESARSPDTKGSLAESIQTVSIQQGETPAEVAKGSYGWQVSALGKDKVNDGLYLTYGLNEVELLGKDADALTLVHDASGSKAANDLRAKVTGQGDLRIEAPNGTVSLSNPDNDYTGKTFVNPNSTLSVLEDGALGRTTELDLDENAALSLNYTAQAIGKLSVGKDAKVLFGENPEDNFSELTLYNGGKVLSDNALSGKGALRVEDGILDVEGSNPNLHTTIDLLSEAKVNLKSSSGLGDGSIQLDGQINLTNARGGALQNQLLGAGSLNLTNSETALTADNSEFSGQINIDPQSRLTVSSGLNLGMAQVANDGYLVVNNQDDWNLSNSISGDGSIRKEGKGKLVITNDTEWRGRTEVEDGELVLGTSRAPIVKHSSSVVVSPRGTLSGFASLKGDLVHAGTLNIGSQESEPSVFLVEGNYVGNGGLINFKGQLEGDSSLVDKLVIRGDSSGTSRVAVRNMGAKGGKTVKGIELIHVDGQSNGEFVQDGRIVAGAFEYQLVRGEGADANHWYLQTKDDLVRPEVGSYIANEETVQTAFVTRQLDRGGKTEYTDFITGEKKSTSLWLRQVGLYNSWKDSTGYTKTRTNRYTAQIGGDVGVWTDAENRKALHLGVMAGYVHSRAISHSVVNGERSIGKTNGYGLGMYATWFADEINREGAYLDAWFNYGWFKSTVSGNDNPKETRHSKGLTGSFEAGYTQKLNSNEYGDWYIQPQAQVVWMGVNTPNKVEKNGTRVKLKGHGNVQTRLGTRFYVQSNSSGAAKDIGPFQLYAEANWIHNTRKFGVTMNEDSFTQAGASNLAEVKLGGEKKLGKNFHLWGNVGSKFGSHSYKELSATIGAKYVF